MKLKKLLMSLAATTALVGPALGQEQLVSVKEFKWPKTTCRIKVNGLELTCQWQDGRPVAVHEDLVRILRRRVDGKDGSNIDCIDAFDAAGMKVRLGHDGTIDVRNVDSAAASVITPSLAQPASTQGGARSSRGYGGTLQMGQAKLQSTASNYTAETGYVRATLTITNVGSAPSPACVAVGEFVDWHEKKFAENAMPLKSLAPGESTQVTFFSMVEATDHNPNGVLKGDKFTCKVRYASSSGSTARTIHNVDNDHPHRSNAPTFEGGRVTDQNGRVISPGGLQSPSSNWNPGTITTPGRP